MSWVDFAQSTFTGGEFKSSETGPCVFKCVDFRESSANGIKFDNSEFSRVSLAFSSVRDVSFKKCKIHYSDLRAIKYKGTNGEGVAFTDFDGAKFDWSIVPIWMADAMNGSANSYVSSPSSVIFFAGDDGKIAGKVTFQASGKMVKEAGTDTSGAVSVLAADRLKESNKDVSVLETEITKIKGAEFPFTADAGKLRKRIVPTVVPK